jgi:hypothetical protein
MPYLRLALTFGLGMPYLREMLAALFTFGPKSRFFIRHDVLKSEDTVHTNVFPIGQTKELSVNSDFDQFIN